MDNTTEQHLHIVSFDIPWPANYGGVIDVFYKISALAQKGIKIHLHCFEYGRQVAPELERYCFSVNYYKRDVSKTHFFKNLPYIVSSRNSEEMINNLLRDSYPILLEGLHTCLLMNDIRFSSRRIIVRAHNIEHDYYYHLAQAETDILKKYYFHNEARKLRRFENILNRAHGIIAISKKDEKYFNAHYQNVVFIPAFHPHENVMSKSGRGDYVLYHGNLSVGENKNAVKFLLEEVFNDLKVPFVIAGLNPSAGIERMVETMPHVSLVANPSDEQLFELINNAQLNVSVTFQATGLKLKLLNTLYNGRFCLVNDKMLSGSTLDELCILANDAASMKMQIKRLYRRSFSEKEKERRRKKLEMVYHNGQNVDRLIALIFS
ncbi:MAG: glycosyltransferase family 1 protein [Bacteroidales bacterium]|nr:glycosyltransferase family 1 protein [Bacteroidales bacterium]